ncbi:MAG: peptidoglycan D,D-transpeptidase FtsI family protein [Chloroflexota bacterium]
MLAPGRFEQRLAATGTMVLLGMLILLGSLTYWQVFRIDLADDGRNPRVLAAFNNPNRGRILDRDGNVLAESAPGGERQYTASSIYGHAVGYLDARLGTQGAELAFNEVLAGLAGGSLDEAVNAELRRQSRQGLDIRLTIDPKLQEAAAAGLGDRRGAVVAIDPRNGEVLAMVSVPSYDPGSVATEGEALVADERSPLLNRATQGKYPPGSAFKTVTAISALEHGVVAPETSVTCPGQIVIDGFPVSCQNVPQGVGTYPFADAFAFSVNAIFAQVGVKLGWAPLLETAERLGFGSALDFTVETAPTQVVGDGSELTRVLLASTAFGQGELLATPLQMAVVAAAIANGGVLVPPHLGLGAVRGGKTLFSLESGHGRRVISERVAKQLRDLMVAVVAKGQASGVNIPGVKVAGKTGTAESGTGTSHAWFIAFAPAEAPTIAVAVLVENGGQGGVVASPIAGALMRAALGK